MTQNLKMQESQVTRLRDLAEELGADAAYSSEDIEMLNQFADRIAATAEMEKKAESLVPPIFKIIHPEAEFKFVRKGDRIKWGEAVHAAMQQGRDELAAELLEHLTKELQDVGLRSNLENWDSPSVAHGKGTLKGREDMIRDIWALLSDSKFVRR